MENIVELRKNREVIDSIDWDMTPEDAVRLYLEWGNNWSRGNFVIKSKDDVSHYFVLNNWGDKPLIYLIRRNSEAAEELAVIEPPDSIMSNLSFKKGVFALDSELKSWLREELDAL
jgi:hypothetical protein